MRHRLYLKYWDELIKKEEGEEWQTIEGVINEYKANSSVVVDNSTICNNNSDSNNNSSSNSSVIVSGQKGIDGKDIMVDSNVWFNISEQQYDEWVDRISGLMVSQLKYQYKGEKGERGKKGKKGDDSYYDIGCDLKKGKKGGKGEKGKTGLKGDRGKSGQKGEQGVNGVNGINGKDGENGVKGMLGF